MAIELHNDTFNYKLEKVAFWLPLDAARSDDIIT